MAVQCGKVLTERGQFGQHFHIDFFMQGKNLKLGLQVHLVVLGGLETVARPGGSATS